MRGGEDTAGLRLLRYASLAFLAVYTRLLSLYHVALPVALVYVARRIGYDARGGYWLQSSIAFLVVGAGRLLGPAANINHAFVDPFLMRSWGGPVTHVAVVAGALIFVAYPVSHLALHRLCRPRAARLAPARAA